MGNHGLRDTHCTILCRRDAYDTAERPIDPEAYILHTALYALRWGFLLACSEWA